MHENLKIDWEGFRLSSEAEQKVFKIKKLVALFDSESDLRLRLIKVGERYEGLLYGRTVELPVEIYQRGRSVTEVLDSIYKAIRRHCYKVWKAHHGLCQRSA